MDKKTEELYLNIYLELSNLFKQGLRTEDGLSSFKKMATSYPPKLHHVLLWHSKSGRNKHSEFRVNKKMAYFLIYEPENKKTIEWSLEKINLDQQSEELIFWLHSLIHKK